MSQLSLPHDSNDLTHGLFHAFGDAEGTLSSVYDRRWVILGEGRNCWS